MEELTSKQRRFCEEYLLDLNGTQAAIRAGYSEKTANEQGAQNLAKLSIQQYISELQKERSARTLITADRVLVELAKIGFSDIKHYVQADWTVLSMDKIKQEDTAAIQSIKTTIHEGTSQDGEVLWKKTQVEFKLHPKQPALESLSKHLGLYKADNQQKSEGVTIKIDEGIIPDKR